MERMKTISMLCVLLACVAPAMAADWYEIPDGGWMNPNAASPLKGFDYNPAADADDWYATTYVEPYSSFVPTPYYEGTGETIAPNAAINDPTLELRTNMITATNYVDIPLNVGTFYVGDTYWPQNYAAYHNTYSSQEVRLGEYSKSFGGVLNTYSFGTVNFGRPADFATPSMAAHAKINLRSGQLNIGTVNQLNTDTQMSYDYPANVSRGLTVSTISTESALSNDLAVTIGDLQLNETMTFLHMNGGYWNITGDVGLAAGASEGNLVAMLFGYNSNPDYDREALEAVEAYDPAVGHGKYYAHLDIKWTTLLDMIDAGQFFVVDGWTAGISAHYTARYRPNIEFSFDDLYAGNLTGVTQLTRANMYDHVDILDNGDGTVNLFVAYTVPEPATLVLLGLGAVLSFRRKR